MIVLSLITMRSHMAHASWWSNFCERHLIADDPYQWQEYDAQWLLQEQTRLKIRIEWGVATVPEIRRFEHISAELKARTK
jgi:hypothetical protein